MKASGQHEWTDYYQAQLLHIRPPLWAKVIIYLFIGLLGLAVVVLVLRGELHWLEIINGVILVVLFLVIRFIYVPWRVRRSYSQQRELSVPWEIVVAETGLEISNEYGHVILPWSGFIKWREDDQLFLLYESDAVYRVFPKRFFTGSEQLAEIRKKLTENHVPVASGPTGCAVVIFLVIILMLVMFGLRSTV
jgi:Ca2+/Na+ antiporter